MDSIVLIVSLVIKALALTMVIFTFRSLATTKGAGELGVYTKYLLLKRRYELLRRSLLFTAAIVTIQLVSLLYALLAEPSLFTDAQLLASDIVFLGLTFLLSKIYRVRAIFINGMEGALTDGAPFPTRRIPEKR